MSEKVLDLTVQEAATPVPPPGPVGPRGRGTGDGGLAVTAFREEPYNPEKALEDTRGDLARGLLWILAFVIGGVLFCVASGRVEGTVLTQSIFPALVTLAGTALGFYFGGRTNKAAETTPPRPAPARTEGGGTGGTTPRSAPPAPVPVDPQADPLNAGDPLVVVAPAAPAGPAVIISAPVDPFAPAAPAVTVISQGEPTPPPQEPPPGN